MPLAPGLARTVRTLARQPRFALGATLTRAVAAGAAACLVPAPRAARFDPAAILREP